MLDKRLRAYIHKFIDKHAPLTLEGHKLTVQEYKLSRELVTLLQDAFGLTYSESNEFFIEWINEEVKGPYIVDFAGDKKYYIGTTEFKSWMEARKRWKLMRRSY